MIYDNMLNSEKYIKLRDEFIEIVVEHYKSLNDRVKSEEVIDDIRDRLTQDIDGIIDEVGLDEAIEYVEDLIENKNEFLETSEQIYAGTFDFTELIDKSLVVVMTVRVGDILFREEPELSFLCKVLGFTELMTPIVEYLNVDYKIDIDIRDSKMYYKSGDIMPYPYMDFHKDKFN